MAALCAVRAAPLLALVLLAAGAQAGTVFPQGSSQRPQSAGGAEAAPQGFVASLSEAGALPANSPIFPSTNDWYPSYPLPGKTLSFLMTNANYGNTTTPNGILVQIFNQRPPGVTLNMTTYEISGLKCGMVGDATYKIKALAPLQISGMNVKVPVPTTVGPYELWLIADSECKTGQLPTANWGPYAVRDTATADLLQENFAPWGSNAYTDSGVPLSNVGPITLIGQPLGKASINVANRGNAAADAGYKVVATISTTMDPVPCSNLTASVTATLPKMASNKVVKIDLGSLVAVGNVNTAINYVHVCVNPPAGPGNKSVSTAYYVVVSPKPTAYVIAAATHKTTVWDDVSSSPKSPKAGKTMNVVVKVINQGNVDGTVGTGGLWVAPFNGNLGYYSNKMTGTNNRCSKSNATVTADFSKVTLKPGQTKTVTFQKVPVPATPGSYVAAVLFDLGCKNTWGFPDANNGPPNAFNIITVV